MKKFLSVALVLCVLLSVAFCIWWFVVRPKQTHFPFAAFTSENIEGVYIYDLADGDYDKLNAEDSDLVLDALRAIETYVVSIKDERSAKGGYKFMFGIKLNTGEFYTYGDTAYILINGKYYETENGFEERTRLSELYYNLSGM